jgi:hypothetical protein
LFHKLGSIDFSGLVEQAVQNQHDFLANGNHLAQGRPGLLQFPGIGFAFSSKSFQQAIHFALRRIALQGVLKVALRGIGIDVAAAITLSTAALRAITLTASRTVALSGSTSASVGLRAVTLTVNLSALCLIPVAPALSLSAATPPSIVTVASAASARIPKLDHLGEAFTDDGPLIVVGHTERLSESFGLPSNLFVVGVLGAGGKTKTECCHDDGLEKCFTDSFHNLGFCLFLSRSRWTEEIG